MPVRLSIAERDFFLELRGMVNAAGLSCRALEDATSSGRTLSGESCFYSKSQWNRWLNGQAAPPRSAVRKLSEHLERAAISGARLVDLWDNAFAAGALTVGRNAEQPGGQLRPRQLPIWAQRFIGRTAELKALAGLASQVTSSAGPVVIVIEGTAGVGKTTLACHLAHGLSDQFPDGQLYVNMRGFDHALEPMRPGEALPGFLNALGVPAPLYRAGIGIGDQAALYRSALAGRRVLIVIDNACDADQVRHLLPGERGCLVLVTSRNRLCGLVAEGAHVLRLEPFTLEEARELLSFRLGTERVERERPAADELIQLCARLPLALGVAAAHVAANPYFPLGVLTEDLRHRGLDALETGDPATTTRTVLARSYRYLNEAAASMFRLLGVHPGPDVSVPAAASLAGVGLGEARQTLDELTRAHLADEYRPGRLTFHALLRAYAAEQAVAHDSVDARRAAAHRVLDHYLHTAMNATALFSPYRPSLALDSAAPRAVPGRLADKAQAVEWFQAETPVLLALTRFAFAENFDTYAWQLPWAFAMFFARQGRWQEMLATQRIAVAAAARLGDTRASSQAHYYLGFAYYLTGDYETCEPQLRQALAECREAGDRVHEAYVLNGLGDIVKEQGRAEEGLGLLLDGLRLSKAEGDWLAQGPLEMNAGETYVKLGKYDVALAHCERALGLHRESGNPTGAAMTLSMMGLVCYKLGDYDRASACCRQAIEEHRALEEPVNEANAQDTLGDTLAAVGDAPGAIAAWGNALRVWDQLAHPRAGQVRAKLAELGTHS